MQSNPIKVLKCLNCGGKVEQKQPLFCSNDCVRKYQNKTWDSSYLKKGESKIPK